MNQQVRRWAQAAAAVLVTVAAVNAPTLLMFSDLTRERSATALDLLWNPITWTIAVEAAGCLVVLALTVLISRRLLHGRYSFATAALLLVAISCVYLWFAYDVSTEGPLAVVYGETELLKELALPLAAGGWLLRNRSGQPVVDGVSPEIPGRWNARGGTLQFEPDGIFTLTRPGQDTVAGLWEPGTGARPQLVLRVDADSDLGHGWQATVLDLEAGPHGAVLRSGGGANEYRREEAEVELAVSHGFVGSLELLEG